MPGFIPFRSQGGLFRGFPAKVTREVLLVTLIALGTLLYRLAWSEAPEIGGDALKIWEFARRLGFGEGLPAKLNHHVVRHGLVLPTLFFQKLAGVRAEHYAVGPIVASTVVAVAAYWNARLLQGPIAGVLAAGGLLWFAEFGRASSQILGEIYGPMYITVGLGFVLTSRSLMAPKAKLATLAAAAICFFEAYGTKLSFLYFGPIFALLLLGDELALVPVVGRLGGLGRFLKRWGLTAMVLWGSFFVFLVGLEMLLFRLLTKETSQLGVVNHTHGAGGNAYVITKYSQVFDIFTRAGSDWHLVLLCAGIACVFLVFWPARSSFRYALGIILFLALQTLILRRWTPLSPWIKPHSRYLLAVLPSLLVLIGVAVERMLQLLWRKLRLARFLKVQGAVLSWGVAAFLCVGMLARVYPDFSKRYGRSDGVTLAKRMGRELSNAYAAGTPMVTTTKGAKPLYAASALFIEPTLLVENGHLPEAASLRRQVRPGMSFLLRGTPPQGPEFAAARRKVLSEYRQHGCMVQLFQRGRFLNRREFSKGCSGVGR